MEELASPISTILGDQPERRKVDGRRYIVGQHLKGRRCLPGVGGLESVYVSR
jgi:hypothetical protein